MNKLTEIEKLLPEMKSGEELEKALAVFPEYDKSVCSENMVIRLMKLSEIYNVYVPSKMSVEIYYKLYLALVRSLQKKSTKQAVIQQNENYRTIIEQDGKGIIGGADSLSIFGVSGIGKSTAIGRIISLMMGDGVIKVDSPYSLIIPCLVVQTPFDCSPKNLMLEILRKVDLYLGSSHYQNAIKSRATTDMLIGSVSNICLNHVGILIIDEIQNVVNSKNGQNMVGMLTQLINNSGISICMVATPEAATFFESSNYLARRSLGLSFGAMAFDGDFTNICKRLYSYQYVRNQTGITDAVIEWLYEHSGGIISNVVSLIHDAQEIAIMNGTEKLDMKSLNEAYKKRMSMLHGYIAPTIKSVHGAASSREKNHTDILSSSEQEKESCNIQAEHLIDLLVRQAKKNGTNIVKLLKENVSVVEVAV